MKLKQIAGIAAGAAVAGALVAVYAHYVERALVDVDRFTMTLARSGLPPAGLTILHLSDLHCREAEGVQERKLATLRRKLADEQYDLLLVTGDLIHDAPGFPVALQLIRELRPSLGAFTVPGNHDYSESSVWGIFGGPQDDVAAGSRPGLARAASGWRTFC